jgi:hypothetical protein
LLIPFLILGILVRYQNFTFDFLSFDLKHKDIFHVAPNFTDEVALTGIIISLLFIAFAKEKREDEFITRTRLESWQWSVLINFVLLIAATWLVFDEAYIDVMMYNMLTVLILFIIRFNWIMLINKSAEEKTN